MLDYEQTVDNACAMVIVRAGHLASRFRCLDDSRIDDIAVRCDNSLLRQLARNDLLELVLEAQRDEGDFSGGNSGDGIWVAMRREEGTELVVKTGSVAVLPVEDAVSRLAWFEALD